MSDLVERLRGRAAEQRRNNSYLTDAAWDEEAAVRIAELEAENARLRAIATAYRAATAWVSADSWDGCSDCMDQLKVASAYDYERSPMTPDELAEALAILRPFKPRSHCRAGRWEMIDKKAELCTNCKFYMINECRRYPPTLVVSIMSKDASAYPPTQEYKWCGEFKNKHEAAK